jgi:hypothetical protein
MGWIVHVDRPVDSGPYAPSMTRATVPSIRAGQSPTTVALLADARGQVVTVLTDDRSRQLRGSVAAAESLPAGPSLGGSRSAERGCTGTAGRCSRPRRKFGFRRRHAPSVRRRRRGVCHCASAQPCLHCSPTQAGQTLLGLAIPRRSGSLWSRWVGCRLPGSSALVVVVAVVGLGWLAVTELLAWVGGSSVSLNCPCADQGGRRVDMVVGADRRGRAGVGVWRDAASGPLTARRRRPRSRLALLLDQADGLAAGPVGPGPAGAACRLGVARLAGSGA